MVKGIALWRLREDGDRQADAAEIKRLLESLRGIPGVRHFEVGVNLIASPESSDISLYIECDSLEDLKAYWNHPLHLEVMPFIKERRSERRAIIYEG
jgi:hypothetical protein